MNTPDISPDEARTVLSHLLSKHHGWWCRRIEDISNSKGRIKPTLIGQTYYSERFLSLYGYDRDEVNLEQVVAEPYRHAVIKSMKKAMERGSEGVTGTIRAITKSGDEKTVEVYVRRIDLRDGAYLASLHSDLSVSTENQWIDRTVLERLQAYVFVKRWNEETKQFVFTYMNKKLADQMGLSDPDEAIGKSDQIFFENEALIRKFREADIRIRDSQSSSQVIVLEEDFSPIHQMEPHERTNRILTFKTPFWSPSNGPRNGYWDVLGIAVDVTSVTDVLRAIADQSNDGLFIKDDKCRYQYVNQKFLNLLGVTSEQQILNRTFIEVLESLEEGRDENEIDVLSLKDVVPLEDESVLKGAHTKHVRTAKIFDGAEWLAEKKPIRSKEGKVTHILGITSPLYPEHLGEMLEKIPQCVCVKKHDPKSIGNLEEFRIVWANRRYLEIHQKSDVREIRGKTDYDLWHPEQADEFRRRDRLVIDIYKILAEHPDWKSLDATSRWLSIYKKLIESKCWEYREIQNHVASDGKHVHRVLQTTKWVESIEGTGELFVVVVYSDVTIGDKEQQRYHELTVHNIRGATAPSSIGVIRLNNYLQTPVNMRSDEDILSAIDCIIHANSNVKFFLQHHLDLLRLNIQNESVAFARLYDIAKSEADKLKRMWNIKIKIRKEKPLRKSTLVFCDPVFMQFVLAELMLNSAKSINRWQNEFDSIQRDKKHSNQGSSSATARFVGKLTVIFGIEDGRLRCSIVDNGAACYDIDEREQFNIAFGDAQKDPFKSHLVQLGLPFCVVAVRAQGGAILPFSSNEKTEVQLLLDLS